MGGSSALLAASTRLLARKDNLTAKPAWDEEIARRVADMEAGKTVWIPASDGFARLGRRLSVRGILAEECCPALQCAATTLSGQRDFRGPWRDWGFVRSAVQVGAAMAPSGGANFNLGRAVASVQHP